MRRSVWSRVVCAFSTVALLSVVAFAASPVAALAAGNPNNPVFAKFCQGPGPNGTVAPGQTDQCQIQLTAGQLSAGAVVRISPTSPGGATAVCTGPNAVQGADGCAFSFPGGTGPSTLGSESLTIPMTAAGAPVVQTATVCSSGCGPTMPISVSGPGAQVTGGGQGGPPPHRTLPSPPYADKVCAGPNPDGSVTAGQSETCTVYASGGAPFLASDHLTVARSAPTDSVFSVTSCAGVTDTSYQTSGYPATTNNLCFYNVVSGSITNNQVIGTEVIAIRAGVQPGTPIKQVAIFCAAPPSPGQPRNCSDIAYPIVVSGPGAIVKGTQTIAFGPLPTRTFGDPSFSLGATASSGLPVSYTAAGPCALTAASPNVVNITGGGVCTITASQPGNDSYLAAPSVVRSFNIDCFASTLPFAIAGAKGSLVFANLVLTDTHSGPGGACGGSFAVQVPLPRPMQPFTVAAGTFTAFTSDTVAGAISPTVATGTLTGTLLGNPLLPFSTTLTLDVATGLGSITATMTSEDGPATVVVTFARIGSVYVITGATRS